MFELKNLPKDVQEKIYDINFVDDEADLIGFVNLKDGWCFECDGSHVEGFSSRKDLIDIVRNYTKQEVSA